MKYGLPMPKEIHCRKGSWTPDDARAVHFPWLLQSPQHNASAFDANGFYCSGDLISIDPEGYITVQGREKDQINRGGEKIAAEEIENLLLRHPAVIYAALVSMEDELMGEKAVLIWW